MFFTCMKSMVDTSFFIPTMIIISWSTTAMLLDVAILLQFLALALLLATRLDESRNVAVPSTSSKSSLLFST